MNERIREFMLLAGTDTSGKWMSIDHAAKFAEFIVQECVFISRTSANGFSAGDRMKEHFGVE